jgi:hypothetical protein
LSTSYIEVPLSNGLVALVDADDLVLVGGYRWHHKPEKRGPGYAMAFVGRRPIYMHRVILSAPAELEVDHRNGDGLDNRRDNLRLATQAQNMQNKPAYRTSTSGIRGVTYHGVQTGGKHHVTYHRTMEAAAIAVVGMRQRLLPFSTERLDHHDTTPKVTIGE